MDQIAPLPLPDARNHWDVSGRQVLGAAAVLVFGLAGATGLVGGLAGHGTVATRPGPAGVAPYAFSARAATSLSRSAPFPLTAGPAGSGSSPGGAAQGALIEQTGAITVVVPGADIQSDTTALMTVATANGGFVSGTQAEMGPPGSPAQSTVTLQVPEASFDQVLTTVKGYGQVSSLTTQANDVTGQYVDLQAQITALQDSRQQYLTIMTKATTIGGVLAVQSQLDTLQSQLDQLQGQLRVLDSETTYAALAVTVTQKEVALPPPRPRSGLDKAWHGAVNGFVAGCEAVVRLAGPILFALLLGASLLAIGRSACRLGRRRRSNAA
jgi:hypothetical protein